MLLWMVYHSELSAGLRTKGLPVRFPVRACAWVEGQVPSRGYVRGNHTLMFLALSFSLPSPVSKNKLNLKKYIKKKKHHFQPGTMLFTKSVSLLPRPTPYLYFPTSLAHRCGHMTYSPRDVSGDSRQPFSAFPHKPGLRRLPGIPLLPA